MKKFAPQLAKSFARPSRVCERGEINLPPPGTKGGENMEPNRIEWQKRCTFNGFCKAVLRNEAIDAIRERKYRKKHEVTFSDLSPQEENQLYTCDKYFVNDEAEKSFFVAGKEITAKQLADALHSLPEEKRQAVLLYYFFDMKDAEIAELMKIPRSTVQFRRTSSFELLKRFLEECDSFADGKKSAHEQRFSVVRRTGSLIGGMTG